MDQSTHLLEDVKFRYPVESSRTRWQGRIVDLIEDDVRLRDALSPVVRQYTRHPGAVAIVALRGEQGQEEVLLEAQYRHPVGARLWEIPAGLLDVAGEEPQTAAARELAEETDLVAKRWDVLIDVFTSPGGSTESLRIFLARDIHPCSVTHERTEEEKDLIHVWVRLDEAVEACLDGRIHNAATVSGLLAAAAARARGWEKLRTTSADWLR